MHLLGHSWGGWLALEYVLGKPRDLVSLVLASTCASAPKFAAEGRRLKRLLPPAVQETIDRHEQAGTTNDPDYVEATMAFYTQWFCRRVPFPDHVMSSFKNMREDIYGLMAGAEWNVTGNLRDWDVTARLGEIDLPVLVTSGRYDEMTPTVVKPLVDGIPGAEWTVFDDCAHLAFVEEPERYRAVVEAFLARSESGRNSAPA
jgi:proline-specific peptidase